MPILDPATALRQSPQFTPPVPRAPVPEPEPSWFAGLDAARQRESITANWITDQFRQHASDMAGGVDPTYNPFKDMAGYEEYADDLGDAVNATDMMYRKIQIDRLQQADRELAAVGGVERFFSTAIAGTLMDPVMIPALALGPSGAALRAGMVAKVTAQGGAYAAADAAVREIGLHAYQPDRDFSDSLLNISASALFGGVISGAIGKYYARSSRAVDDPDVPPPSQTMTRTEVDRLIAYLEQDLADNVTMDVPSGAVVGSTNRSMASTLRAMKSSLQRRVAGDEAAVTTLRAWRRELLDQVDQARVRLNDLREGVSLARTPERAAAIERRMDEIRMGVETNKRIADNILEQMNYSQKSAAFDLMNIQEWETKYSPGEIVRAIEQKTTPDRVLVPEPIMPDREAAQLTTAYQAADDTPSAGVGSVGAAEVLPANAVEYETALDSLELVGTNAVARTISRATPIMRLLVHSNSTVAERAMSMFETTAQMRNSAGEMVVTPVSAERNAKRWVGKAQLALRDTKRLHRQYRKNGGDMPYGDFKNEIASAMRRGDVHIVPEVQEAAQLLRREVYDPLFNEGMQERVFDDLLRETYRVSLRDLRDRLKASLSSDEYKALPSAVLKPTQEDLDSMVAALARSRDPDSVREAFEGLFYDTPELFKKLDDAGELTRFSRQLEEGVTSPQGAVSYLSRVYDRNKVIARRGELHQRLYDYFARQRGISPDKPVAVSEIEAEVEDAINSILGSPSGVTHAYSHGLSQATAAQTRVLNVPDSLIEDFLVNDVEQLVTAYARDIGIRIELSKASLHRGEPGAWRLISDYEAMEEAHRAEMAALPEGSQERLNLQARFDKRMTDFKAGHQQLLGLYGLPDNPHSFLAQVPFLARSAISLSAMGQVALTSVPDLAKPIFNFGVRNVIKGLVNAPFLRELREMTVADLQAGGAAMELVGSMRAKSMADVEFTNNASRLSRGVNRANEVFFTGTGLNHWNTALESLSGMLGGDQILRAATKLNEGGKLTDIETSLLRRYGIDDAMARRIAKQPFDRNQSLWAGGTQNWPDREAANAYTGAIGSLAHEALAQPGVLDVPLLYRKSEWGRLLGSLQTFAFSQVSRFVIPLLTRQVTQSQLRTMEGVVAILSLGAFSLYIKALVADKQSAATGKPNPYATRVLRSFERAARGDEDAVSFVIGEALDRSGLLGPISTWAGMAEATFGPSVSLPNLVSLATTGEPNRELLRKRTYQQGLGAMLGPSSMLYGNISGGLRGVVEGDAEAVIEAGRKLTPANNLIGLSALFDLAEEAAKEAAK